MKIILLKNIPKLGKIFDLKRVRPGYARNFLIPQNLAILATKKNLKWREEKLKIQEREIREKSEKLKTIAEKLKKFILEIPVKTGLKGELFQKITEEKIAKFLQKEKFDIKKEDILLKEPITTTGDYSVKINLAKKINTILKIKIKKEEKNKNKKMTTKNN